MRIGVFLMLLVSVLLVCPPGSYGQDGGGVADSVAGLPPAAPRVWRNPQSGRLFWNKHLPVYLFLSTHPSGADAEHLDSHSTPQYGSPFYFDTEGVNYMRTRWAVDSVTKRTVEPRREVLWEVYADGLPPVTSIHFNAKHRVTVQNRLILGAGAQVELSAKDAVSGVRYTFYSLKDRAFARYDEPVVLGESGTYEFFWCSEDEVGNREKMHSMQFAIDLEAPVSSSGVHGVRIRDDNTVAKTSSLYLESTDNLSGVAATYYRIDSGRWLKYHRPISLERVQDGPHALEFYSEDRVGNREDEDVFPFYLDNTPPIMITDVLGDKFVVGGKVFFSGRTKLKITAVDNHSGVKSVQYRIDKGDFQEYTEPFYMPNTQGWHTVNYFAVDSTENLTSGKDRERFYEYRMKVDRIYVDLTGPTIDYSLKGRSFERNDTVFISPETLVTLKGHDEESELKYLAYAIDGDAWEKTYEGPFNLEGLVSGEHRIEFFGYDNVGNRNVGEFTFVLDSDAPQVAYELSVAAYEGEVGKEGESVYPKDAKVFLTGQDNLTGISTLEYSLNGQAYRMYRGAFGGLQGGKNRLSIRVVDKVGNRREARAVIVAR